MVYENPETGLARAGSVRPLQVRISLGSDFYASLLPNRELYISGALLERVENEAELAGLLAHELAHESVTRFQVPVNVPASRPTCVLASRGVSVRWTEEQREAEMEATKTAINILKVVGYEPNAVLDLLSKLAYEHPAWAKAIVPDDLLNLRAVLEPDVPPEDGYLIDSSNFVRQHRKLSADLGHGAARPATSNLTSPPKN
jgi:hypothetical protein